MEKTYIQLISHLERLSGDVCRAASPVRASRRGPNFYSGTEHARAAIAFADRQGILDALRSDQSVDLATELAETADELAKTRGALGEARLRWGLAQTAANKRPTRTQALRAMRSFARSLKGASPDTILDRSMGR